MDYFIVLTVLMFGLVIGSFLNVVIFRLDTEEDIVNSRSKCMSCGGQLKWRDLVPVLSFIILKGKCRYCGQKISWQYPIVEISTAIFFVILFSYVFHSLDIMALADADVFGFYNVLEYLSLVFIFSALMVIFVFDLKHYIIPDEVIYPAIAVALFWRIFEVYRTGAGAGIMPFVQIILPALMVGGFFLFLVLATRGEGMGGGDVKLGALMGLVLGFSNSILALLIAFISGAIIGIALIASRKKNMKSMVPFGPFLVAGTVISFFWGGEIIGWYWGMVLG